MDRDTVIALARQAGYTGYDSLSEQLHQFASIIEAHLKDQGYRQCAKGQRTTQFCGMLEQAVEAEREECAKVCDEIDRRWINQAEKCAAAIRGRNV
jgi:hypothetical protein